MAVITPNSVTKRYGDGEIIVDGDARSSATPWLDTTKLHPFDPDTGERL